MTNAAQSYAETAECRSLNTASEPSEPNPFLVEFYKIDGPVLRGKDTSGKRTFIHPENNCFWDALSGNQIRLNFAQQLSRNLIQNLLVLKPLFLRFLGRTGNCFSAYSRQLVTLCLVLPDQRSLGIDGWRGRIGPIADIATLSNWHSCFDTLLMAFRRFGIKNHYIWIVYWGLIIITSGVNEISGWFCRDLASVHIMLCYVYISPKDQ